MPLSEPSQLARLNFVGETHFHWGRFQVKPDSLRLSQDAKGQVHMIFLPYDSSLLLALAYC